MAFARSSAVHRESPFRVEIGGQPYSVEYAAGDSPSWMFGGNSNWRGPIWFPINYLLIEALERYHHFYGDMFVIECPTGSGVRMNLDQVARELSRRLAKLLPSRCLEKALPRDVAVRCTVRDPHWKDLVPFHGTSQDDGHGLARSHQTRLDRSRHPLHRGTSRAIPPSSMPPPGSIEETVFGG